jgi:hypothetical protein
MMGRVTTERGDEVEVYDGPPQLAPRAVDGAQDELGDADADD